LFLDLLQHVAMGLTPRLYGRTSRQSGRISSKLKVHPIGERRFVRRGSMMLAGVGIWGLVGSGLRPGIVVGDSMAPTLRSGQWFVMDVEAYRGTTPRHGDIVVFRHQGRVYVKRVLGAGGDTVRLLQQQDADGLSHFPVEPDMLDRARRLCESRFGRRRRLVELRVPQGHVYVIGDMVTRSLDSRHLGPIPLRELRGRVCFGPSARVHPVLPPVGASPPAQHASYAGLTAATRKKE
jgi:signal peptidase I